MTRTRESKKKRRETPPLGTVREPLEWSVELYRPLSILLPTFGLLLVGFVALMGLLTHPVGAVFAGLSLTTLVAGGIVCRRLTRFAVKHPNPRLELTPEGISFPRLHPLRPVFVQLTWAGVREVHLLGATGSAAAGLGLVLETADGNSAAVPCPKGYTATELSALIQGYRAKIGS